MAGDWIKVRKCLFEHPKVMRIASSTGLCEEVVVGWLCKVWCWADGATDDGNVASVTHNDVVRVTGAPVKFLAAMQSVGWFVQTSNGIMFPDYEEHMSNSAKKRANTAKRVAKSRGSAALKMKRSCNAGGVTREEKRREEKKGSNTPASVDADADSKSRDTKPPTFFDTFWNAVHRKVGKQKARTAFSRAAKTVAGERGFTKAEAAEYLTERMRVFASSRQAADPVKGQLHPATWLNEGRYDDDETIWNPVPKYGEPGFKPRLLSTEELDDVKVEDLLK